MLLYWRKRKDLCLNTPFLKLNLNKILRSINKITSYFEVNLPTNDFVKNKSLPLTKQTIQQVKETSIIVEFAKDLHKDSL